MPLIMGILAQAAAAPGPTPGAGAYDLLETEILTGDTASITFSSLGTYASDYQHLQIRAATRASVSSFDSFAKLTFNGSSTNYQSHALFGDGSSVTGQFWNTSTYILCLFSQGNTSTANAFGAGVIDILDPFSSSKNTTIRDLSGRTANDDRIVLGSGAWFDTTAISSITLTPSGGNFKEYSRFSLYGLRKAA